MRTRARSRAPWSPGLTVSARAGLTHTTGCQQVGLDWALKGVADAIVATSAQPRVVTFDAVYKDGVSAYAKAHAKART